MVRTVRGCPRTAWMEASVAGESPDRSEQRKSSGTAPEEGDPRLTVRREPAASSAADTDRDTGTDTDTAVFRSPSVSAGEPDADGTEQPGDAAKGPEGGSTGRDGGTRTAEDADEPDEADEATGAAGAGEDDPEPEAEAEPEPEPAAEPVDVPADPDETGSVRLRAAVAAWVSADAPGAGPDAADTDDPDDGSADTGSADAPHVPEARDSRTAGTGSTGKAPASAEPDADVDADADEQGIDHPTAVFKAPRPPRRDQPTTALRIPPKAPKAPKPAAPAERNSTFVPLRSDDVPPPAATPSTTGPTGHTGTTTPAWNTPRTAPGLTEAERTRQQPMPPKPPLDLLAELTNTPPPPETPVRTVVRRVKIWTPLLLIIVIIFAIAQAVRPLPDPELVLSADPTYTFGGGDLEMPWPAEGQGAVEVEGVGTIGAYGKEEPAPIASVAKVMTAYVILKEHPITGKETGEQIEVDKKAGDEADRPDESTAPIEEGQKYTERQMLELLMIPSGNNVARLLARWDATNEDAFVEKMNAAAKDLGMTKTTYTDPSGLAATTKSTPSDLLKLAKAVMQNDVFRKIVNMPQVNIPGIAKTIYNNNNILLEPGVSGIKTGSSTPAGGNLLWAADTVIDGKSRRIIGVVMGADTDGTLDDKLERARQNSLKLIRAAQKGVDSSVVVKKGQIVGYVDDGLGGQTPVVSTKDLKAIGWGGLQVKLDIGTDGRTLAHAAKPGTVVGSVTVGTGTGRVTAPVALQSEMTEPTFGEKLTRIG